jgi:hypothetical protein
MRSLPDLEISLFDAHGACIETQTAPPGPALTTLLHFVVAQALDPDGEGAGATPVSISVRPVPRTALPGEDAAVPEHMARLLLTALEQATALQYGTVRPLGEMA